MGLFTEFYNVAGDIWTFEPTEHPPLDEPNTSRPNQWSSVIHTAKVRFNCQVLTQFIWKKVLMNSVWS